MVMTSHRAPTPINPNAGIPELIIVLEHLREDLAEIKDDFHSRNESAVRAREEIWRKIGEMEGASKVQANELSTLKKVLWIGISVLLGIEAAVAGAIVSGILGA